MKPLLLESGAVPLPVDLPTLRGQCRVHGPDDDALLTTHLGGAIDLLRDKRRVSAWQQVYRVDITNLCDVCPVQVGPFVAIRTARCLVAGQWVDVTGALSVMPGDDWGLWCWHDLPDGAMALQIDFVAGYGPGVGGDSGYPLPSSLRAWLMWHVAAMYANPDGMTRQTTPDWVNALIGNDRVSI